MASDTATLTGDPDPLGLASVTIRPAPTEEEAAAVVAALEMLWPRPAPVPPSRDESTWRFSGRWWGESRGWPRRRYR